MFLFSYIGLTLISWLPVLAPLLVVGGIVAFVAALVTPERTAAPVPARTSPARSRVAQPELVLEHAGDVVLDLRDPQVLAGHRIPRQHGRREDELANAR